MGHGVLLFSGKYGRVRSRVSATCRSGMSGRRIEGRKGCTRRKKSVLGVIVENRLAPRRRCFLEKAFGFGIFLSRRVFRCQRRAGFMRLIAVRVRALQRLRAVVADR